MECQGGEHCERRACFIQKGGRRKAGGPSSPGRGPVVHPGGPWRKLRVMAGACAHLVVWKAVESSSSL